MKKPLVSIIIPVYNGSDYLSQAIDSALAQTYENIEIIVVNDGSSDGGKSERIALGYKDRIRYFKKENGGVSTALNLGISHMRGQYFSWLSHDDLYMPEKIESQVGLINVRDDSMIYMCGTSFIDADTRPVNRPQRRIKNGIFAPPAMLNEVFSGFNINGCALLINKELFERFGLFDEQLRYMQDLELWYRMMINGVSFLYDSRPLAVSRIHRKQVTITGKALASADAVKVGEYMTENLKNMYNKDEDLLKKYMYLCFKKRNVRAGQKALAYLRENGRIGAIEQLRARWLQMYGGIRPRLSELYYKFKD